MCNYVPVEESQFQRQSPFSRQHSLHIKRCFTLFRIAKVFAYHNCFLSIPHCIRWMRSQKTHNFTKAITQFTQVRGETLCVRGESGCEERTFMCASGWINKPLEKCFKRAMNTHHRVNFYLNQQVCNLYMLYGLS